MILGATTKRSKVIYVYKGENLIATYQGFSNAARATGVKVQNIYKACNGYKTTLNGLTFKIKDE